MSGPAIAWDEVRVCPVCGVDVLGIGEVSCGDHFRGFSFQSMRRVPEYVKIVYP